jgi:hypothetical protein
MMRWLTLALSLTVIAIVLVDAFEAMLLPRRVARNFRLARQLYRSTWLPWSAIARRMGPGKRREVFLGIFGPLSMLVLFSVWAIGLILGFALLHWSLETPLSQSPERASLFDAFYMSGVTFFTLGYGDVTPVNKAGRFLAVVEAGVGFGFLAVVISYLPVLYQAFSRREVMISLLDARAGSPPTAAQLLVRSAAARDRSDLGRILGEYERWSAELLESHLSFAVLSYYRSQHDNQSWLAAATAILDTCSLLIAAVESDEAIYQAGLTFAMTRHAVVDLAQAFKSPPHPPDQDRLPPDQLHRLRDTLRSAGITPREGTIIDRKLTELRAMYEPFVVSLSAYFVLPIPPFLSDAPVVDNWQTSAWMRRTAGMSALVPAQPGDDHLV